LVPKLNVVGSIPIARSSFLLWDWWGHGSPKCGARQGAESAFVSLENSP
jgi:hypothetical protein